MSKVLKISFKKNPRNNFDSYNYNNILLSLCQIRCPLKSVERSTSLDVNDRA